MAALFPTSNQSLSENLSTEEYNALTSEVTELNARLDAQATGNLALAADLATATASVTELTAKLTASEQKATDLAGQVTSLTSDRDKYKAHYDKAASAGKVEGNADANSLNSEKASYNQHAIEVFHETHGR